MYLKMVLNRIYNEKYLTTFKTFGFVLTFLNQDHPTPEVSFVQFDNL